MSPSFSLWNLDWNHCKMKMVTGPNRTQLGEGLPRTQEPWVPCTAQSSLWYMPVITDGGGGLGEQGHPQATKRIPGLRETKKEKKKCCIMLIKQGMVSIGKAMRRGGGGGGGLL